jgi:toxin ParE1/3/4
MAKLTMRQEAIDDLSNIWRYTIVEWSENQANKYYRAIKSACKEISKNPNIGRAYTEISGKLLGFKTGKHVIFYLIISEDEIEVIRILHEQMDLENRLLE